MSRSSAAGPGSVHPTVTNRYKGLVGTGGALRPLDHGAFLSALHHRLIDRIGWDWGRGWLHAYSHLELSERHGWPLLLLVLEAEPGGLASADILQCHIRMAAAAKGDGPLADLASSIEVVQEVAR
jgi:hypothetical protein